MKKYFTIIAGIAVTALITTGCEPVTYAQTDNGYYNQQPNNGYNAPPPDNGYNSDNGYGDGQPGDNDIYNQPPVDPNSPNDYSYPQQPAPDAAAAQPPVGFNDFYNQLAPYGNWVNMPPYGQVWINNQPNFQPYSTNGYWAYTTYGWTWVSNYPWGWAPFHYGRWGYSNMYGWYWVPGYVWGPAWVAWSSSADMYGWAPLMPGMHFGVSLSMGLFPSSYWTFMQGRYMGLNNIGGFFVNRSRNVSIIRNTALINNFGTENNRHYTMGPRVADVQRYTGNRKIQPLRVTNAANNKGVGVSNNELRVYRPVTRPATSNRPAAPANNNRAVAPQTRPAAPANNNKAVAPQARPAAPANNNRAVAPQTRPSAPANNNKAVAPPQAKRQPAVQRAYKPTAAQPAVTNTAAPQSSAQIQAAERARAAAQRPAQQKQQPARRVNTEQKK